MPAEMRRLADTTRWPLFAKQLVSTLRLRSTPRSLTADAEDLTQGFFARCSKRIARNVSPEKGKFRAFLLVALEAFFWQMNGIRANCKNVAVAHFNVPCKGTLRKRVTLLNRSRRLNGRKAFTNADGL